jgi:hypothetical protein
MTNILKVAFLVSIVTVSIFVVQNSFLISQPLMASAITFDLVITLPIAYWFFVRKTKISRLTVGAFVTFGIILASVILPADNRQFLNYLTYFVFPVAELGLLAYAGFIIYRARKTYESLIKNRKDFLEVLRMTLLAHFPSSILAKAVSFEIAGFYYAFFSWKSRRGERLFTYHKNNGTSALLLVLGFIIAVETLVLHILIAQWSVIVAWVLSAFSIYFLFQIFAHGKAIFVRPIEITDDKLFIRCGLLGDAEIDLENIESVENTAPPSEMEKSSIPLSPLGKFALCNVKISLRKENVLNGIYGKHKSFETIYLTIDESEKFKAEIERFTIDDNKFGRNDGKS